MKQTIGRRFLALLLAVVMLGSNGIFQVLAEELYPEEESPAAVEQEYEENIPELEIIPELEPGPDPVPVPVPPEEPEQNIPAPTTPKPTVPEPTTEKPAVSEPTTEKPAVPEPTTEKPAIPEPTTEKPAVPEPTTEKPTVPEPTTEKPTVPEPTTEKPAVPEPTTEEPTVPEPTDAEEAEQALLSVVLTPQPSDGVILLRAELQQAEEDQAADLALRLDAAEAALLKENQNVSAEFQESGDLLLKFSVSAENPVFETRLCFAPSEPDFTIEIRPEDLTTDLGDWGQLQFEGAEVTFAPEFGWNISAQSPEKAVWTKDGGEDIVYTLTTAPEGSFAPEAESQNLELILSIPQELTLPQGELTFDAETQQILKGETPLIAVSGLPENSSFTDLLYRGNLLGLYLTIPGSESAELTLTVLASALTLGKAEEDAVQTFGLRSMAEPDFTLNANLTAVPTWGESYSSTRQAEPAVTAFAFEHRIDFDGEQKVESPLVIWVDNRNEDGLRPDRDALTPTLQIRAKPASSYLPSSFSEIKQEHLQFLNLKEIPTWTCTEKGNSDRWVYTLDKKLPETVTVDGQVYTLEWRVLPKAEVNNYVHKDYTGDNLPAGAGGQAGWYYMVTRSLNFRVEMRSGEKLPENATAIMLENFQLVISYPDPEDNGQQKTQTRPLTELKPENIAWDESGGGGTLTIPETWKYNIDGTPITYKVEQIGEGAEQREIHNIFDNPEDKDDYFKVIYDNSGSINAFNKTDALYSNGKVKLVLSGDTTYQATKVWLDDRTDEVRAMRPYYDLQLWRYRKGQPHTTASAVLPKDSSSILTLRLDTAVDEQRIAFQVEQDGQMTDRLLPKYDSEGYEYIYVTREYPAPKEGPIGPYQQVFGKVVDDQVTGDLIDDGTGNIVPVDKDRSKTANANNINIYNGATISNQITDNIVQSVTKTWSAAAFQAGFGDVEVKIKMQYRVKGTQEWKDEDPAAPDNHTITMKGFTPENLSQTVTRSLPRYDSEGRELEYQWVEAGVYQGDPEENLFDPETKQFKLRVDGKQVMFESEEKRDEHGNVEIINDFALTTNYFVHKKWQIEDEKLQDQPQTMALNDAPYVTFKLYRSLGDGPVEEVVPDHSFRMDGIVDDDYQTLIDHQEVSGAPLLVKEYEPWKYEIKDLEEYTEDGRQYSFFVLECRSNTGSLVDQTTIREQETNDYYTTLVNGPGTGNKIHVRKVWIDDSDLLHRQLVTVQAFNRQTNEPVGEPLVLGENDLWYGEIGIGELTREQVYVLETKVGDMSIPLSMGDTANEPKAPVEYPKEGYTSIRYATPDHAYEAVYGSEVVGEFNFFTVSNRRIGEVTVQVEKQWLDGDGSKRNEVDAALARAGIFPVIRLEFQDPKDGWGITRSGVGVADKVTVGNRDGEVQIRDQNGDPVSSTQKLNTEDNQIYYFCGLPKYDAEGAIVHYTAVETFQDSEGNRITREDIAQKPEYADVFQVLKEYTGGAQDDLSHPYETNSNRSQDTKYMIAVNRLSGSKNIHWHKQWKDAYNFQTNQRPDIFLDIYRVGHEKAEDGTVVTKVEPFQKNYRWNFTQDAGDSATSLQSHWHASIENVPKYDALGYEYFYYAVEKTHVSYERFDYLPTVYRYPADLQNEESTQVIGDVHNASAGAEEAGTMVKVFASLGGKTTYALKESGTFENRVSGSIELRGRKLWKNLPFGYSSQDLPQIHIEVSRKTDRETDWQRVAGIDIQDWKDLQKNNQLEFSISKTSDGKPLAKYDTDGYLYTYKIEESQISWPETIWPAGDKPNVDHGPNADRVFDVNKEENSFQIANIYNSDKGSLSVRKILQLRPEVVENGQYPAVWFGLWQTYTKNDGSQSKPVKAAEKFWSAEDVKKAHKASTGNDPLVQDLTFENLDLYAPNGSPYVYEVREIMKTANGSDFLVGYQSTAKPGTLTAEEMADAPEKTSVEGLVPVDTAATEAGAAGEQIHSATFYNKPAEQEHIILKGSKLWTDLGNIFGTRPGIADPESQGLTLTLYRWAPPQPGQDNGIFSKGNPQKISEENYTLTWTEGTDNTWNYTIEGKPDTPLERYAPNGMPWNYRVTETLKGDLKDSYRIERGNVYSRPVKMDDGKLTADMEQLKNSLLRSVPYQKNWVDSEGKKITTDYFGGTKLQVGFQLQVKDGEIWKPAEDYFTEKLGDDYAKAFPKYAGGSYSFDAKISGPIVDSSKWGVNYYFRELPMAIRIGDDLQKIEYRVVETGVKFDVDGGAEVSYEVVEMAGGHSYSVSPAGSMFAPFDASYTNTASVNNRTNKITTTELKVTKTFEGDNNNIYGTRPLAGNREFWNVDLALQCSADGVNWELMTSRRNGRDVPVILHIQAKANEPSGSVTIKGLPAQTVTGKTYQYRAVELQPKEGQPSYWYGIPTAEDVTQNLVNEGEIYRGTYTARYDGNEITNTLRSLDIRADKNWIRSQPAAGKLTLPLTLQYQAQNGQWVNYKKVVTLDGVTDQNPQLPYYEDAPWHAVWNGVPEKIPGSLSDENGKTKYRIVEPRKTGSYIPADGAKTSYEVTPGQKVSFTNVEAVSLTIEKLWGLNGTRPRVTFDICRTTGSLPPDGIGPHEAENIYIMGKTIQVSSTAKSAKLTVGNLPKYDKDGKPYTYYAVETSIDPGTLDQYEQYSSHSSAASGNFTTRLVNIGKTKVEAEKIWKDNSNEYGTRPDSVTLELQRRLKGTTDGWDKVTDITLYKKNFENFDTWTHTFENLPLTDRNGSFYEYQVAEPQVPQSKKPEAGTYVNREDQNSNRVTNVLTGEIDIEVDKKWVDANNYMGLRPASVHVVLYEKKHPAKTFTATTHQLDLVEASQWKGKFEHLSEYDENGIKIQYTLREKTVPAHYEADKDMITETPEKGLTVTNRAVTSFQVTKIWGTNGTKPEITYDLCRTTGELKTNEPGPHKPENIVGTYTLQVADDQTSAARIHENLPLTDKDGNRYKYYAVETDVEGGKLENYRTWTQNFEHKQSGEYQYSTILSNSDYTERKVTKFWKDNGNAYGTRPDSLKLTIQRKLTGELDSKWTDYKSVTLKAEDFLKKDEWTHTFDKLPLANEKAEFYDYRIIEPEIPVSQNPAEGQYVKTSSETGNEITNTLTKETELKVVKKWLDGDDHFKFRPKEITVKLLANGKETGKSLTLKADLLGKWEGKFDKLQKFDENGKKILYTVTEEPGAGYQVSYLPEKPEVTPEDGYTVTNQAVTDFEVTKIWGIREADKPAITYDLCRTTEQLKPGEAGPHDQANIVKEFKLTDADGWTRMHENLPLTDEQGKLYTYYAVETAIDGRKLEDYQITYRNATDSNATDKKVKQSTKISNIGVTTLRSEKTWKDNNNLYLTRPKSLDLVVERTLQGTQNWQPVKLEARQIKVDTANNPWVYTFTDLPLADIDGKLYDYRITEPDEKVSQNTDVGQYQKQVNADGSKITNTLTKKIPVPVEKLWIDNGNNFKLRPESIQVVLYANGEKTDKTLTLKPDFFGKWQGEFTELDKFDAEGKRIQYTVREEPVPDHYHVSPELKIETPEKGLTITNTGEGRLVIEKSVTRGDRNRLFDFQVTIGDGSTQEEKPEYPYVILNTSGKEREKGTVSSGDVLRLRHGEKAKIDGLPHKASYRVEEINTGSYYVKKYNSAGILEAGKEMTARFVNSTKPSLIQTGQNWILPLILAIAGMTLALTGVQFFRKKRS